jgi:hypothetical protein
MIAYALPTSAGRVLWYPAPRAAWGFLRGLGDEVTVLSPVPDLDVSKVPAYSHDNVYRFEARQIAPSLFPRWGTAGRLMMWGIIWLLGMRQEWLEAVVGGLYLLLGLPLFLRLSATTYAGIVGRALARFRSLAYSPRVRVVYSPRLEALEKLMQEEGPIEALHKLDEFGLGHLREFYRRTTWRTRWDTPPVMGQGEL